MELRGCRRVNKPMFGLFSRHQYRGFVSACKAPGSSRRARQVDRMAHSEMTKVSTSETGMDQSTPSSPKKTGSTRAKPTPNTTSRTMDSRVDSSALPRD